MFDFLMNYLAPPRISQSDLNRSLIWAVYQGKLEEVRKLLTQGAQINCKSMSGMRSTPLITAIDENHFDIAQELLRRGADVHIRNNFGTTALISAARKGNIDLVRMILLQCPRLDVRDSDGYAALHIISAAGHLEILRLLLQQLYANIDVPTGITNQTPLMLASRAGKLETVRELLKLGAKIDQQDCSGCTALIHAASQGKEEVVQELLEHRAAIDKREQYLTKSKRPGRFYMHTALVKAAYSGHAGVVRQLLACGAGDYRHTDGATDGYKALKIAAINGHVETVSVLLANGSMDNENQRGELGGEVALISAANQGHTNVVKMVESSLQDKFEKQKLGIELFFLGTKQRPLNDPTAKASEVTETPITKPCFYLPNTTVKLIEDYLDTSHLLDESSDMSQTPPSC